jgi:hypothetical protein
MANPPHDEHLLSLHEAHLALLAAVAQGHGVTAEAALEEARNCISRHATEAPSLESAARLVAEMRHWATTQAPAKRQRAGKMDLRVEWSGDDGAWAAVFIRDGQPWWLDGTLVGMESTPAKAVEDLLGVARHLVIEGSNFLMEPAKLDAKDRRWLFNLTDVGVSDDLAYAAVRNAEEAER